MEKKIFISILIFLTTLLYSCGTFDAESEDDITYSSTAGNDYVEFWVLDLRNNTEYKVSAYKKGESQYAYLYVATDQEDKVSQSLVNELLSFFDNNYPRIVSNFGEPPDVDNNGKIVLLLLDIKDDYTDTQSGGFVIGFFDYLHEYSNDTSLMLYGRHSNQMDMLFLDTYPTLPSYISNLKSTLFHELQHAICFNQNHLKESPPNDLDTWIEEGLSMAAEDMVMGIQTNRITYYLSSNFPNTGYSLIRWCDSSNSEKNINCDVLSNYSLSYLFMQFVRGQAGTDNIYKSIIEADGEDINAFNSILLSYTGKDLKTIFKHFIIANWWDKTAFGNPPSNYSYNDTGIYTRIWKTKNC